LNALLTRPEQGKALEIEMTGHSERRVAAKFAFFVTGLLALASPAASQQPTSAQRDAIRQACRSDYEAHCASVPPGGQPALACLQKNMSSLSGACQTAVGAISKSAATPAAAPAKTTATPSTAAPKAATSAAPKQAAPAAPAAGTAAAAPATVGAAPVVPMRAITPREEIRLVRFSCGEDFRTHCSNVQLGGGRAVGCLRANAASLSPTCQSALLGLAQSR